MKAQEKTEKLFLPQETENLHGELEKDLEKFRTNPRLFDLLPPPSAGCPLVLMDIELKEEWEGKPLRQRCWPMSINEQQEINLQAEEILNFPPQEKYHMSARQHFWLTKRTPKPKGWSSYTES